MQNLQLGLLLSLRRELGLGLTDTATAIRDRARVCSLILAVGSLAPKSKYTVRASDWWSPGHFAQLQRSLGRWASGILGASNGRKSLCSTKTQKVEPQTWGSWSELHMPTSRLIISSNSQPSLTYYIIEKATEAQRQLASSKSLSSTETHK